MDNASVFVQSHTTLLMKHSKRFFLLSLAAIVGLGGAAATALAQSGDTVVSMCYRGRKISVPSYLVSRYITKGAVTLVPPATNCTVTPA